MSTLSRYLIGFAAMAIAFAIYSSVVATGAMHGTDLQVAAFLQGIWVPATLPLLQGVAVLGGIEITTLLVLAMAVYVWRIGFRTEVWAFLAFPVALALELLYKHLVDHRPPVSLAHGDGPSLSQLLGGSGQGNSFPSGHMMRTVLVYGLLAFVINRLAERRWLRLVSLAGGAVLIILMAFDRLYLEVHWESDVIGGFLLGSLAFLGATIWLDRPGRLEH